MFCLVLSIILKAQENIFPAAHLPASSELSQRAGVGDGPLSYHWLSFTKGYLEHKEGAWDN